MAYHKVTIEVLLDVGDDADAYGNACDAVSEAIRPMLREFSPRSSWIDWRYADNDPGPSPHDGNGFGYATQTEDK